MKFLILSFISTLLFNSMASALPSRICNILLGSGGFSGSKTTMVYLAKSVDAFLGSAQEVLVIPYALKDPAKAMVTIEEDKIVGTRKAESVTSFPDPQEAVMKAQAILVMGGNTFRLLDSLYKNNLLDPIRKRVNEGIPYVGISAGTNVATPTIKTTNDMPIIQPSSLNALGLVPFQINPHYFSGPTFKQIGGRFEKHAGETRDDRIGEFHQENEADVVGIPEATFLSIQNGKIYFLSLTPTTLRLFRKNQDSSDHPSNSEVTHLFH